MKGMKGIELEGVRGRVGVNPNQVRARVRTRARPPALSLSKGTRHFSSSLFDRINRIDRKFFTTEDTEDTEKTYPARHSGPNEMRTRNPALSVIARPMKESKQSRLL